MRRLEDEQLLERIWELHAANHYACGSRRMWKALRRDGEHVGCGRVERLMRRNGIQGAKWRGKPWRTTIPDADAPKRPDLVQPDFSATRRTWSTSPGTTPAGSTAPLAMSHLPSTRPSTRLV